MKAWHASLTAAAKRLATNPDELAKSEIERARRYRLDLSLIVLDLDRFKSINDTHGYEAGDIVLQVATSRICAALREGDLFVRIGGEALAVLVPHTGRDPALEIAERLLGLLRAEPLQLGSGDNISVTASAGVASFMCDDKPAVLETSGCRPLRREMKSRNEADGTGRSQWTNPSHIRSHAGSVTGDSAGSWRQPAQPVSIS